MGMGVYCKSFSKKILSSEVSLGFLQYFRAFCLYSILTMVSGSEAEDVVPINGVCFIKEPYFKVMNDGGYGLRVDHVTDLHWLSLNDDRVPMNWRAQVRESRSANVWKEEGNKAMRANKPHRAVEL